MDSETSLSILLIDSNDTDRNYYADRLRQDSSEYVVHLAATGEAGLAIFETKRIDCVVLEMDLADMSGLQVLVRLVPVARKPEVAVVILTHVANLHLASLAMKNGAVAWLLKSGTPGDVLDQTILRAVSVIAKDRKKALRTSTPQERNSHTQRSTSSASKCTVLLIEDDPGELAFWSSALTNCSSHYSVLEAMSGEEGLELLRQHKVDCVVLDLDLSSSSGFQFLLDSVPNRHHPEIAVLIFTRLQNPTLESMALENGAHAYLIKQRSSPDVLDKTIQKAVTAVTSSLGKDPKLCA
jgi:DNA-binding NarL/FixJ family response regulator